MRKIYFIVLIFIVFLNNPLFSNDLEEAENADIFLSVQEPLFVSLGSYCEVSHVLRACSLRKAAFPFDWITSLDSEKFLQVLADDFQFFLTEHHLQIVRQDPGPLLNSYYHLEFLHEGDFRGHLYIPNMKKFQAKYKRRIERFKKLSEYKGKVIFIRTAYQYSMTDPHRFFRCKDNLEITDEYSWRLYVLLKERFPNLDFTLIIINNDQVDDVCEDKKLTDNLIKVKSNPNLEVSAKWNAYKQYFNKLLQELK